MESMSLWFLEGHARRVQVTCVHGQQGSLNVEPTSIKWLRHLAAVQRLEAASTISAQPDLAHRNEVDARFLYVLLAAPV